MDAKMHGAFDSFGRGKTCRVLMRKPEGERKM